jgi:Alg9-like mannosyltransferase family
MSDLLSLSQAIGGDPNPTIRRRRLERADTNSAPSTALVSDRSRDASPDRDFRTHPIFSTPALSKLFILMLLFRIYNSLLLATFFDPDEYYQSLEVAHNIVFGRGYLTWEWTHAIRGFAHPSIFVGVYSLVKWMGLEGTDAVVYAPKITQAVFAAVSDLFTFMLAFKMFGPESARWTYTCMIGSWFNFYTLCRTYSNSMETSIMAVALYFWPRDSRIRLLR